MNSPQLLAAAPPVEAACSVPCVTAPTRRARRPGNGKREPMLKILETYPRRKVFSRSVIEPQARLRSEELELDPRATHVRVEATVLDGSRHFHLDLRLESGSSKAKSSCEVASFLCPGVAHSPLKPLHGRFVRLAMAELGGGCPVIGSVDLIPVRAEVHAPDWRHRIEDRVPKSAFDGARKFAESELVLPAAGEDKKAARYIRIPPGQRDIGLLVEARCASKDCKYHGMIVLGGDARSEFGPEVFVELASLRPQGQTKLIVRGFTHEWMLLETRRCAKSELALKVGAFVLAPPPEGGRL